MGLEFEVSVGLPKYPMFSKTNSVRVPLIDGASDLEEDSVILLVYDRKS